MLVYLIMFVYLYAYIPVSFISLDDSTLAEKYLEHCRCDLFNICVEIEIHIPAVNRKARSAPIIRGQNV